MSIQQIIADRGIEEVVHYTTNRGLVGILDSRKLSSRARINDNQRLEHILNINTPKRTDTEWIDYVNLSISRINSWLFGFSLNKWHQNSDVWWVILSFDPEILSHEGVYFATTNNIYPAVVRGQGGEALELLYADTVQGRYHSVKTRSPDMPDSYTTCEQAEILYPGEISTEYLRRIYVSTEEDQDDVYGQILALNHSDIDVIVEPNKFQE